MPKIAISQQPGCTDQPLLAMQSKNKLVKKKKTGSLEGDSTLQCNTKDISNEKQGTTTDSLSMHKLIIDHIQTGNSEPLYQEITLESSTSLEYDAPYDHMFEQLELQ